MIIYLTCDEHLGEGLVTTVDRDVVAEHLREKHSVDVRPYTALREKDAKAAWVTRNAEQDTFTEFDFILEVLDRADLLTMQLDQMMAHLSGRIVPYDPAQADVPPFKRK
jgi:hypothetical protein